MQYTQLHNVEFNQGKELFEDFAKYDENKIINLGSIRIIYKNNGVYALLKQDIELEGFVLDLKNSSDGNLIMENFLQIVEKLFSFYIKKTKQIPLSSNEFHIKNTNHYFINPFGFAPSSDYFKMFISVLPDENRDIKRNIKLFLNIGDGYGQINYNNYNKSNYRLVIDSFKKIQEQLRNFEKEDNNKEIPYAYQFEESTLHSTNLFDLSVVSKNLTNSQKEFIENANLGPCKLIGPAGAGKTVSLLLKSIFLAKNYEEKKEPLSICFVCHSESMKDSIMTRLTTEQYGNKYINNSNGVMIKAYSLLDWCIQFAVTNFDKERCLEVDSADAKLMQEMLIDSALQKVSEEEYNTFRPLLSKSFLKFFEDINRNKLIHLLQNEISLFIKGNNIQYFEDYKQNAKKNKLFPWENETDLGFIYSIYDKYQEALLNMNKYDLDDITNVALSYLRQGIWKRERRNFGFDVIFIDELHLFDFHELNIIKYMLKNQSDNHLIYATDIAQSIGDIDIINNNINSIAGEGLTDNNLNIIFRSSETIINLVDYLFNTYMHLFSEINPLKNARIMDTDVTNKIPELIESINDEMMISKLLTNHHFKTIEKSKVLNVVSDLDLLEQIKSSLNKSGIDYVIINKRNELSSVVKAQKEAKLIFGYIDYVGGLEFDYVNLIGFDKGRVPPEDNALSKEFFEHIWYRKIYVAITRARRELIIYTNNENGRHSFIDEALKKNLIDRVDSVYEKNRF
jgi:ribosomal protein L7Ae-like RNA K-turn-binding protein